MTSQLTFYLSRIIGNKIYDADGNYLGRIIDLIVQHQNFNTTSDAGRPKVISAKTKIEGNIRFLDFSFFEISRIENKYIFSCKNIVDFKQEDIKSFLFLAKNVLDKQIVDINGRKLVRVNDIRLVVVPSGTFAVAVDIGTEGLLRRIGVSEMVNKVMSITKSKLNANFILWDDVETIDHSNSNIKLSSTSSKLHTLHPSDLADIIEEMGKSTRTAVFASLDEEKAADVLEEMEPSAQAHIIESLSIEKAADVLEKMPADEVADLLDSLEKDKAELLLNEMEKETSEEVRELLLYDNNEVGSLMTTDFITFRATMTIEETLKELRRQKPETDTIYSLFVTDADDKLMASVSIRDLVISEPDVTLAQIMRRYSISVFDDDKIDSLAEIISKYNLLAIPVTSHDMKMEGMVVIDDIVEDLLNKRKTK